MGSKKAMVAPTAILFSLNLLFSATMASIFPLQPPPPEAPPPNTPPPNAPPPNTPPSCPLNTLQLGACVDVLRCLLNVLIGPRPTSAQCCTLLDGLVDLKDLFRSYRYFSFAVTSHNPGVLHYSRNATPLFPPSLSLAFVIVIPFAQILSLLRCSRVIIALSYSLVFVVTVPFAGFPLLRRPLCLHSSLSMIVPPSPPLNLTILLYLISYYTIIQLSHHILTPKFSNNLDSIPMPIVMIDQDLDIEATIVQLSFGDRLGTLIDMVTWLFKIYLCSNSQTVQFI
ncbi:hypothetical protein S245_011965 [Arachis hypogaea]